MAGGLEQGDWGLGRVSNGLEGLGPEGGRGLGAGAWWDGTDIRIIVRRFVWTFRRSDRRTDEQKFAPLVPSRPLRIRCPISDNR